jgi:modulator of FtsH protease
MIDIMKPTHIMTDSAAKVLKNTYLLVALGLLVSLLSGLASNAMGFGLLFSSSMSILIVFALQIGLILLVHKFANSETGIWWMLLFCVFEGVILDPIFTHYLAVSPGVVISALGLTTVITVSMALIGVTTKRDLSFLGKVLFASLFALLGAMILNIFIGGSVFSLVISAVATVIFSLFIMHDTNEVATGREDNYVRAALGIYLNIINLLIHLMRLLSSIKD